MAVGMTIIKRMTYKGDPTEEWSNKYHLSGADPADAAAWLALFNALTAQEKTLYESTHVIVRGYGYTSDASTAAAVWSRDLTAVGNTTIPGTFANSGGIRSPGDTAAWVRWKTSRLSVKGKPIYLRKYYHGVALNSTNNDSPIATAQVTAYAAFGTKLLDGSFLDGRTIRAPGQSSETLLGSSVSSYPTTRTLKRRGKRPNS